MDAQNVLENLRGLGEPARVVSEDELPDLLKQGRTSGDCCDCKGCDKD